MKVGFIWNTISDKEYQLANDVHRGRRELFLKQFAAIEILHLSARTLDQTFIAIFDFANACGLDFCLLSHHSAWAINPERIKALFETEGVRKAAIAVRAGKIYAKAGVFSPKAPYIDSDFIIVNVRQCMEMGIQERIATAPFVSHFTDAGGVHADLMAFLETIVPYGALYVYDDGSALRDLYGHTRARGFAPTPYLVDTERGFVSCDAVRDSRVHILRAVLLQRYGIDNTPLIATYVKAHTGYDKMYFKDNFPFFKEPFLGRLTSWAGQIFKNAIRKVNFEIHKKYADRT